MIHTAALRRAIVVVACLLAFAPLLLRAQSGAQSAAPAAERGRPAVSATTAKPIALEDYGRFKRLGGGAISPDGAWMLYTVTPNEGDGTLFVKSLDTATPRPSTKFRAARAPPFQTRAAGSATSSRRLRAGADAGPVAAAARSQPRRARRQARPNRPRARSNCSIFPRAPGRRSPPSPASRSRPAASGC
jgi:hypothetical protein